MGCVNVICEFLEVATHTVLYMRQIYPPELFEKKRKYNITVYISRSLELNKYIATLVDDIRSWVNKAALSKFIINITNTSTSKILERYVFDFLCTTSPLPCSLVDAEASLRTFLLKLSVVDRGLELPREECAFAITIHTNGDIRDNEWIQSERFEEKYITNPLVTPIKSLACADFKLQLYIERNTSQLQ